MKSNINLSRRKAIVYGAGLLGTGSLVAWLEKPTLADNSTAINNEDRKLPLTPDQALKKLMAGNDRFVENKRNYPDQDSKRLKEIAQGQNPFVAILGCADSRVPSEIIFDQGLGDIFNVRVAGNISTIEDVASEEYAVAVLNTPLLMVLGHQKCGAVDAAIKGGNPPGMIGSLVFAISPAVKASEGLPGDRLTNAIVANIKLQVSRLKASSLISNAIKEGKLKIVGAYYHLDSGKVSLID